MPDDELLKLVVGEMRDRVIEAKRVQFFSHLLQNELVQMAGEGLPRDTLIFDALRRRGWLDEATRTIHAPPDVMAEAERRARAKLSELA